MKFFTVSDIKKQFSEAIETSQDEIVIITNHGKPVAAVIGIRGLTVEDVCKDDRSESIQTRFDVLRNNEDIDE